MSTTAMLLCSKVVVGIVMCYIVYLGISILKDIRDMIRSAFDKTGDIDESLDNVIYVDFMTGEIQKKGGESNGKYKSCK